MFGLSRVWAAISDVAAHAAISAASTHGSLGHARSHAINGGSDHTGTLDDAQIPSSIARDAEVTTAVSDHAALADPHAGYVLESLLDAKGDLIAASADNTPAKVTVGADGTFLKADSAAGAGVSWATPTATAAVLVGPKNTVSTVEAIAANTYVHVGRSLEITSAGSIEIVATSILEITP